MAVQQFGVPELLGVAASASVVPVALFDPAIGGLVAWGAIAFGGVLALRGLRFAYLSIATAVSAALVLSHYTAQGFFLPTTRSLTECGLALAPPLVPAMLLIAIALYRRRRTVPQDH